MTSYLLDVNLLIALLFDSHLHYATATTWFNSEAREWRLCCYTEGGYLRYATAPRRGQLTLSQATTLLSVFVRHPGYQYLPIETDWHTLSRPFFRRLQGTKQVTDAFLLGLAIRNGLRLATMDRGIVHLAGPEFADHVLLIEPMA